MIDTVMKAVIHENGHIYSTIVTVGTIIVTSYNNGISNANSITIMGYLKCGLSSLIKRYPKIDIIMNDYRMITE